MEPRWLTEAKTHIGLKEYAGAKNNPTILRWWQLIRAPFTNDATPWCAGYVGGVFESVGIRSTRSAAARSYQTWGIGLRRPAAGCVVVFWRGSPQSGTGHVGFVMGEDSRGNLMVLGGNQGDEVNVKPFDRARVLAYRWPKNEPLPADSRLPRFTSSQALSINEA